MSNGSRTFMRLGLVVFLIICAMVPLIVTGTFGRTVDGVVSYVSNFGRGAPVDTSVATSGPDAFTIRSFSVDYLLERDDSGTARLTTVETIVAEFPDFNQNHGIIRDIPLKYQGVDLLVDEVTVTDETGRPLPFTYGFGDEFLTLRIGDAASYVHGIQHYVVRYLSSNVIGGFRDSDGQEFYWDVNGTGWAQPFDEVSATIRLGAGLAPALTGDLSCYRGVAGSTETCEIARIGESESESDGEVIVARTSGLTPRGGMTVAIGFEPDTFVLPYSMQRESWYPWYVAGIGLISWLAVVPYLIGLIVIAIRRIFVWRDAPGRPTIIAEYEPPKGVDPMFAAFFFKQDAKAWTAAVVDLAVRGFLRIVESPESKRKPRFWVERTLRPKSELDEQRRPLLAALFSGTADAVVLDPPDNRTLTAMRGAAMARKREAASAKYFSGGTGSAGCLPIAYAPIAVIAIVVGAILPEALGVEADLPRWAGTFFTGFIIVAALVLFLLCIAFANAPQRLTTAGAELRDALLGLKMYMRLAEADRLRVLQSVSGAERIDVSDHRAVVQLNELLLPYAVIWGFEREWAEEIAKGVALLGDPAESRTTAIASGSWSSLPNLSTAMTSAVGLSATRVPPAPSSSSSSSGSSYSSSSSGGSSGGGSSGGGGGGGGGGGW